jgi:hypothetical protein
MNHDAMAGWIVLPHGTPAPHWVVVSAAANPERIRFEWCEACALDLAGCICHEGPLKASAVRTH